MKSNFFGRIEYAKFAANLLASDHTKQEIALGFLNLSNGKPSGIDFLDKIEEEACKYRENKRLAGKKGGLAKLSSAKAKASSAKAVLSSAIAKPSTPLANNSSSSSNNNRKRNISVPKRDAVWDSFVDALNIKADASRIGKAVKSLKIAEAQPKQIWILGKLWNVVYPEATMPSFDKFASNFQTYRNEVNRLLKSERKNEIKKAIADLGECPHQEVIYENDKS